MTEYRELSNELRQLKDLPWSRLSITDDCITLNGKTLNFKDGYSWKFEYNDKDYTQQSQWTVKSCLNIEYTHRQLLVASRRFNNWQENAFVAKLHPSSRKLSLFGDRALHAIEMIDFITNKQVLVKMKGKYWCIVDTMGQIKDMPLKLRNQLEKRDYRHMKTKYLHERGTTLLILSSNRHIDVIELSHRGEVRQTAEFEVLPSLSHGESQSILADSLG